MTTTPSKPELTLDQIELVRTHQGTQDEHRKVCDAARSYVKQRNRVLVFNRIPIEAGVAAKYMTPAPSPETLTASNADHASNLRSGANYLDGNFGSSIYNSIAREMREAARGLRCDADEAGDAFWIDVIAPVIEKAFATQANEIWEEAARAAEREQTLEGNLDDWAQGYKDACIQLASICRSHIEGKSG